MLRATQVSVNNGTLHFGRSISQIANGTRSPTCLSSLEHSAESFAVCVCTRCTNILLIYFPRQVPFIHRKENLARINGTVSLKKRRLSAVVAMFQWAPAMLSAVGRRTFFSVTSRNSLSPRVSEKLRRGSDCEHGAAACGLQGCACKQVQLVPRGVSSVV